MILLPHVQTDYAATYYTGKTNCSNTGPGSQIQPRCTISSGISLLSSGDTLKIMAGSYIETVSLSKSNVTVDFNNDGEVIIDGNNALPSGTSRTYSPLVSLSGSNSVLRNVTVANSRGEGIEVTGTSAQLNTVFVHHSGENGIILKGNYSVCDGCKAWSNAMSNAGGTQSGGWGTGISACRHPQHATIRNSIAWDNWGEGLSTFEAEYTTIENSISYNNWAVNMYLSDTTNTIARGNIIYMAGNTMTNGTRAGLAMGDEVSNPSSANNIVINNFIYGGNHAFWVWDNHQQNTIVANNTFVNATSGTTVEMNGGTNNFFRNNIIIQDDSRSISGGTSGFTLANNLWSKTYPGKGTTDAVGNPQLARTGTVAAGTLTGDWFKLTSASTLAIDKASIDPNVTVDFFKTPRPNGVAPDIGAHEYIVSPSITPIPPSSTPAPPTSTASPTAGGKAGDANGDNLIDGRDYVVWVNHYGTTSTGSTNGDFNNDSLVDGRDYVIWVQNYGK
jgi:hypothetical protein